MATKVSAVVSTYNAEEFFRGRIENLLEQTLHAAGRLEIVVVNCSKQGEEYILREFQEAGAPLQVITTKREPLYVSWNRAIKIATGDYLTSANTDDRLAPHALMRMAGELDTYPEVGVVYGDSYVSPTPNPVWGEHYDLVQHPAYPDGKTHWPTLHDPKDVLKQCPAGPHPMWRKSLHDEHGLFDESFLIAGDFEFWLRLVAAGVEFRKIEQTLGIFHSRPDQLSADDHTKVESFRAIYRWQDAIKERYP